MNRTILKIVAVLLVVFAVAVASAIIVSAKEVRPIQPVGTGIAPLQQHPVQGGVPVGGSAGITPSIPIPPPVTSAQQQSQMPVAGGQRIEGIPPVNTGGGTGIEGLPPIHGIPPVGTGGTGGGTGIEGLPPIHGIPPEGGGGSSTGGPPIINYPQTQLQTQPITSGAGIAGGGQNTFVPVQTGTGLASGQLPAQQSGGQQPTQQLAMRSPGNQLFSGRERLNAACDPIHEPGNCSKGGPVNQP